MTRLVVPIALVLVAIGVVAACGDDLLVREEDPATKDGGNNTAADGSLPQDSDGSTLEDGSFSVPDAATTPTGCHARALAFGPPSPLEFLPAWPSQESLRHPFVFNGGRSVAFERGTSSSTIFLGFRDGGTGPFTPSMISSVPVTTVNERYPTSNLLGTELYFREYNSTQPMQRVDRVSPPNAPIQFSNATTNVRWPSLSEDGLVLVAMRADIGNGNPEIVQVTRLELQNTFNNDDFTAVVPTAQITNATSYPAITPDALGLFLFDGVNTVLYTRPNRSSAFTSPKSLQLQNPAGLSTMALHVRSISIDGCTIYLTHYTSAGLANIYSAARL
jgi:hypothetical protein